MKFCRFHVNFTGCLAFLHVYIVLITTQKVKKTAYLIVAYSYAFHMNTYTFLLKQKPDKFLLIPVPKLFDVA